MSTAVRGIPEDVGARFLNSIYLLPVDKVADGGGGLRGLA
jgi:hypothetical protein